jgi:hypothetical protein
MVPLPDSGLRQAGLRALPIRMAPGVGEAFDSWLDRYAARFQATRGDVADAIGLNRPTGSSGRRLALNWTTALGPDEVDRIVRVTGLDSGLLTSLTLQRYDGIAVILDRTTRQVRRSRLWGRGRGSSYCPACLAETGGRWELAWRLSWSFCCLRHRVLLVDRCPGCRRIPRSVLRMELIPDPGRCTAPSREPRRGRGFNTAVCGFPLAQASAVPVAAPDEFLRAQAYINRLLDSPSGCLVPAPAGDATAVPPRQIFADLKALAGAALDVVTQQDLEPLPPPIAEQFGRPDELRRPKRVRRRRPSFLAPRNTAQIAFAVSKAVEVVTADDLDTAAARFSWVLERMRGRGQPVTPTTVSRLLGNQSPSPGLQQVGLRAMDGGLRPLDRLRYGTATPQPRRPRADRAADSINARAAKLPQQMWPAWALRLMPPTGHDWLTFRRVASTALLVPGNRRDLGGLLRLLGQPCEKKTFEVVMRKLARRGVLTLVLRTLGMLSTCLDEHQVPIDYQRRRRLFGSAELLPEASWKACCSWAGVPSTPKRYGYAHRYVLELLTGSSDTPRSPLGYLARGSIAGYTGFCAGLPPALADRLRAVAEQLLADNRLYEPLTWEPPFDWVGAHEWPGPHVDTIQPAVLRSLLLDEQRSLTKAAAALETSVEHLHLVLVRHPIGLFPERQARPGRRRWRIRPATLTPERVAYLYQECGWSYTRIARQEGVGAHLVGRLARLAGVRTRSLGKPETYGIDVDWLAEQYLVRQRTIADIAAELGLVPRTVSWVTRRQGLMRYSLTAGGSILNDGHRPFACAEWIRPAFSRRGALLRIQRFLALIEYPTYREAAKVLGINQTRLSNQVQQLERDLKVALLVRSNRSANHPLRLTSTGRRFVRDAKTALANLRVAYAAPQSSVAARPGSGDKPADSVQRPAVPSD